MKNNFLADILKKSNNPSLLYKKGPLKMIYLNPKTYLHFRKTYYKNFGVDLIRYDGIYFVSLLKFLCGYKYGRNSFDFTSLADKFFKTVKENNESIEIYGGSDDEITKFINFIREKYQGINITDYDNGFKNNEFYQNKISLSSSNNILIGLGSIKQEEVVLNSVFNGKLITCGAFISQTSNSDDGIYYPIFYKNFGILWLYRIITEKGHWKRLSYYPKFTFYFINDLIRYYLSKLIKYK